jgi:uncharacterized membrane protein YtjA (UPF0391 family)
LFFSGLLYPIDDCALWICFGLSNEPTSVAEAAHQRNNASLRFFVPPFSDFLFPVQQCRGGEPNRFPRVDLAREFPAFGDMPMGNLLHYAVVFLIVALVAAFLGFGGVAGTAMEGARLLFWVAIVFFIVSLVAGLVRRA